MRLTAKAVWLFLALLLILALLILLSLSLGEVNFKVKEIFAPQTEMAEAILWKIRLPRILLAAAVGGALALAGVVFQAILRNPLADPYLIGTSAGAALGAALILLTGSSTSFLGFSSLILSAFVGALLAMYLVYILAKRDGKLPVDVFLLAGVVVGSFLWALVSFIMSIAGRQLQEIVFWLMGSLQAAELTQVLWVWLVVLAGGAALYLGARALNLLCLGDEIAQTSGLEVEKAKKILILIASLITATSVSVCGIIGFIGLIIPHLMRMLIGSDNRLLLPAAFLGGALFLVAVDDVARLAFAPREIPVGIITSLLGAPFFLWLLYKTRRV
jgi:iron complex transport system permease protein